MNRSEKLFVLTLLLVAVFTSVFIMSLHENFVIRQLKEQTYNETLNSLNQIELRESNLTEVWKDKDFTVVNQTYCLDVIIPNFGTVNLENKSAEIYRHTDSGKVLQYAIDNLHGFDLQERFVLIKAPIELSTDCVLNGNGATVICDFDDEYFLSISDEITDFITIQLRDITFRHQGEDEEYYFAQFDVGVKK